jgi:hypothetical protein
MHEFLFDGTIPSCPPSEGSERVVHYEYPISDLHRDQFAVSNECGDLVLRQAKLEPGLCDRNEQWFVGTHGPTLGGEHWGVKST